MAGPDLAGTYLGLRRTLTTPGPVVLEVPADANVPFWTWYAGWLRGGQAQIRVVPPAGATFPAATGEIAQWRSNGLASAYTDLVVGHLSPTTLRHEGAADDAVPLLFGLAVRSARRGASCAYVGVHRRAALAPPAGPPGPADLDADLEFLARWNEFHPTTQVRTVCAELTRDQLVAALPPGAEHQLEGCGRAADAWCGDCATCFDTYYAAKAVGRPMRFRLSPRIFASRYDHGYRPWLTGEFAGPPDAGFQLLARLALTHGLRPDRTVDVDDARAH
ncbi:hypothetical protein GCM10027186_18810 [Micromonospora schwarzwaldensis]